MPFSWFLGLIPALLSPVASAQAAPARPEEAIQRTVLENGLTVLLAADHSSPLVTVGMMYAVGARNENAGITGLAHYVEHMNFRATRNFPGSLITDEITRIGGRFNGYTWLDQTYYAETVRSDALDRMLDIELDRMTSALYEPDDFAKERTSVIAELHSYEDPYSLLYDAVLAASFEIHPYRHNSIGWLSDVEQVTRDEAYAFYRRFYHPNNAVLVVVGDMDPFATLEKVRRRFASLPARGETTAVRTVEPAQTGQRRLTLTRPGPHAEVLLAFRAPALTDADFPAMVLFDALVSGGKGFRFDRDDPLPTDTPLHRATVAAGLATMARADWQASRYPYVYTVSGSAAEAKALPAIEKALLRTLEDAARRDWTDDEIRIALRQMRTGWASDLDDKAGRAHQLAFFEVSGGHQYVLDLPERVARVSRDDLRRFAAERLRPEQATVGWFVPGGVADAKPRSSDLPPSGPTPTAPAAPWTGARAPESATTLTLKNGLRAIVAPGATGRLVALRARIEAGSAHDGRDAGLSALLTELLSRPAPGERSGGPALAFTLHDEPEGFANFRWIEVSGISLREDVAALLSVLGGRLRHARNDLTPELWRTLKQAVLEEARELQASPATLLWQQGLQELYPQGTPLVSPPWGREQALQAVGLSAFRAFARSRIAPQHVTVVLTGAVAAKAAEHELETAFGTWTATRDAEAAPPRIAAPRGPDAWKEIRIDEAGASQNEILILWPGDRSRPWDEAATQVVLYLLGETGYAGRLGQALVNPGLVYSVETSLEEEGFPGFLAIRTAAAPRDTAEVLKRIRGILEEATRGSFTSTELAEAKDYLRGKGARSLEGAVTSAQTLLSQAFAPEAAALESLTLEQLNDTARRFLRAGAPVALVAGPRD